jgi:hypothetical protein
MSELAPETPVEPQAEPEAQVEPEAAAEPWAGPTQEEWEATQERLAQYEAQQQPEEGEPEPFQLDPYADDFQDQLDRYLDSRLAPVSQYTESAMQAEAEERAMDIIQDIASREGEFLFPEQSPKIARSLANEFIGEEQQRYGFGPKAAEAALERAVKAVREYEQTIGKAYHERQMNQLGTLAGAPRQPGVAGTQAAPSTPTPEGGDELALVGHYFGQGTGR